jgi:drug/metabolite transporter (DMT)-like permease
MFIDWSKVAPVIVSILIIIAVAILRQYSKTFAAIAATMPINIPLGLWIMYSGTEGDAATKQKALADFGELLLVNIFPTVAFLVTAWLMTRAGHSLLATIIVGYVIWAVLLGAVLLVRGR